MSLSLPSQGHYSHLQDEQSIFNNTDWAVCTCHSGQGKAVDSGDLSLLTAVCQGALG